MLPNHMPKEPGSEPCGLSAAPLNRPHTHPRSLLTSRSAVSTVSYTTSPPSLLEREYLYDAIVFDVFFLRIILTPSVEWL